MYNLDDPEEMSYEERLDEIATILASGYLRLKKSSAYIPEKALSVGTATREHGRGKHTSEREKPSELPENSLD